MPAHIHLHRKTPLRDQPGKGHNRWHPDITPGLRVPRGATVELDCIDAVDTQVQPGMKHEAVLTCDLSRAHPMTGPVYVEGAEPGDLLAIKVENIQTDDTGFTMILPGVGYLRDVFTKPFLVHWEIRDGFARSEQIPGVRIPGAPFMGVMGVAPSHQLLERINTREAELASRGGFVLLPEPTNAIPADPTIARSTTYGILTTIRSSADSD